MMKILVAVLVVLAVLSVVPAEGCDCNYHPGGCAIVKAAPPGQACRCTYQGAWTCAGSVKGCRDANSRYCRNPDSSLASCLEGGGDCGGY